MPYLLSTDNEGGHIQGEESTTKDSLALIFHSGAYDRVSYGLSMAIVALTTGMDVHALFTHGALKRLVKGGTDSRGRETDDAFRRVLDRALDNGIIEPISQQIADGRRLGLKIYACVTAMALFDVINDELVEDVDRVIGIATFLDLAREATIVLYI